MNKLLNMYCEFSGEMSALTNNQIMHLSMNKLLNMYWEFSGEFSGEMSALTNSYLILTSEYHI